jgi:hypothetical protein
LGGLINDDDDDLISATGLHNNIYYSNTEVRNGGGIPPLPLRLQGVMLNELSTGTTLLFYRTKKIVKLMAVI